MSSSVVHRTSGALLATAVAAVTLRPVHDPDVYWHLVLGRAVWQHKARVVPEPLAIEDFSTPATVAHWLFDLLGWAVYSGLGWFGIWLCIAACAIGATLAIQRLAQRCSDQAPAAFFVAALAAISLLSRMRMRPQSVFLLLLPCAMLLALRYAAGDNRRRDALWLVGLEVLWAQNHGSFVLVPALFAIAVAPTLLVERSRDVIREHLLTSLGLILGLSTSAYGLGVVDYVFGHASGYAVAHLQGMAAPTWGSFSPLDLPYHLVLWLLAIFALRGLFSGGREALSGLGFALLGVALLHNAVRFLAATCILLVPLAARGAGALHAEAQRLDLSWLRPALLGGALLTSLFLLGWAGHQNHEDMGPWGQLGPARGSYPTAAAAALNSAPPNTRALTSIGAGPAISLLSEGRVRTFVDARTPYYFDDTDFAVAREIWYAPGALSLGVQRYSPEVLLLGRNSPSCEQAPPPFVATVVEPGYTLFERGGEALRALAACGPDFLGPRACEAGALAADLERLDGAQDGAFAAFLEAAHAARCQGDAAAALQRLPSRREAHDWRGAYDRVHAALLVATGRAREAAALLEPAIAAGDALALETLRPAFDGALPPASVRRILEVAEARWDDDTPPPLRVHLAFVCMQLGDAACVRFHAFRAAARGESSVVAALHWLAERHPDPRAQRDAQGWLKTLGSAAQ